MDACKVSVIIPVYNVESYLRQCLDSAAQQTLREIEIILVDDGSSDTSGEICDEYAAKDARITVIHQTNGGAGSARNVGLAAAKGDYIGFIDSDDYIDLNALRELYETAVQRDLDVLLFGAEIFVEDALTHSPESQEYWRCTRHVNEIMSGADYLEAALNAGEYNCSNCLRLYRSAIFDHGRNIRYCAGIIHEDEDVGVLTLIEARRVMRVDRNYYHRRYRANSIMTSLDPVRSAEGYLHAALAMLQRYDRTDSIREKQVLLSFFDVYMNTVIGKYAEANVRQRREIASMASGVMKKARSGRYPFRRKQTRVGIYSLECCRLLRGLKAVFSGEGHAARRDRM